MTWVKGQSGNPNGWAKTNAEVEALTRCWGISDEMSVLARLCAGQRRGGFVSKSWRRVNGIGVPARRLIY
jgi:hypothetical protein